MTDIEVCITLKEYSIILLLIFFIIFVNLNFISVPYGKFIESNQEDNYFSKILILFKNKKLHLNGKICWCIQEFPSFGIPFYILIKNFAFINKIEFVMLSLFIIHYFNR